MMKGIMVILKGKFTQFFVALLLFSNVVGAKDKTYYTIHEKGWHWYQAVPKEEQDEEEKLEDSIKAGNPVDELKEYQRKLEEAKALAVMDPTPENIERYQYLQYEALERAHKFSQGWMENVYKNTDLNYALQ